MKPLIAFLLVLFNLPLAEAQINFVPNPSFEDTISCPSFLDNMQDVQEWSSFRNSSDYFNGCSVTQMNVPNTTFGFQYAHSGTAFSGMITYLKAMHPNGNNYREYIGVQLLNSLQLGTRYYFSFYAVSGDNNAIGFYSNNIGLRFFTNSYSKLNPAPLDNFAHIKLDSLLNDTTTWYKISGSFIADSNYQYVSIGNFFDYLNTDTLAFTPFPQTAYTFIDDVCVTTDSLYNDTWTGLHNVEPNEVLIWPNPVKNYIQYKTNFKIEEILIYNSLGKLLSRDLTNSLEGIINLREIANGIYFISFRKEKTISVYKFLKL